MHLETCIRKGLRLKSHRVREVHEDAGRLVAEIDWIKGRTLQLRSPSTSAFAARRVSKTLEMPVPHCRVSLVAKPNTLQRGGHFE